VEHVGRARLQAPGVVDGVFHAQVDGAVAGQAHRVGGVVETVAVAGGGDAQAQRAEAAVHVDAAAAARAAGQQLVVGGGAGGAVARVGEAGLGIDVETGQRQVAGQFGAADAGFGDVDDV